MSQTKRVEAMVSSAVPSVPFSHTASTGSRRGRHSRIPLARHRLRPPKGTPQVSYRRSRSQRQSFVCRRRSDGCGADRCGPLARRSRRRWRRCTSGLRGSRGSLWSLRPFWGLRRRRRTVRPVCVSVPSRQRQGLRII